MSKRGPGQIIKGSRADSSPTVASPLNADPSVAGPSNPAPHPSNADPHLSTAVARPSNAVLDLTSAVVRPSNAVANLSHAVVHPSNAGARPSNANACLSNAIAHPSNAVVCPSIVVNCPPNAVARPSNVVAGLSNVVAGPSNAVAGSSNAVADPSSTVASFTFAVAHPLNAVAHPLNTVAHPLNAVTHPLNAVAYPSNAVAPPSNVDARPKNVLAQPLNAITHSSITIAHPSGTIAHTINPLAETNVAEITAGTSGVIGGPASTVAISPEVIQSGTTKRMRITEEENRSVRNYWDFLHEIAEKYKLQNGNNPQERCTIKKLESYGRLLSEIDFQKTLGRAFLFSKTETARDVEEMLKEKLFLHFGFRNFKPNQVEIMKMLLNGRDLFVRKPTGGGKSLLYNLPCLISKGTAIVISPLKALMKDQIEKLHEAKIPSAMLHSDVTGRDEVIRNLKKETIPYKVILLTAEQALSSEFRKVMVIMNQNNNISYLAVDECHVIIHDAGFRFVYERMGELRESMPDVPIVAVTATATPSTQAKIIDKLKLNEPVVFLEEVHRDNINIEVKEKKPDKINEQIVTLIRAKYRNQTGIIYFMTTEECRNCTLTLKSAGIKAESYYSNLEQKDKNQDAWMQGKIQIIVCTNSFGMGVDKSNVRFVVHGTLSHSVEDYYQQYGRVGRDGLPAVAITYYHKHDVDRVAQLIAGTTKSNAITTKQLENLLRLYDLQDYMETKAECRTCFIQMYFGDRASECAGNSAICDNCYLHKDKDNVDVLNVSKAIITHLLTVNTIEFMSLRDILKGMQNTANSLRGALCHWPTDEIERFLRHLIRHHILTQTPLRDPINPKLIIQIGLGQKAENLKSAMNLTFPLIKESYAAIMALEKNEPGLVLPQINSMPLDTQTREVLNNAVNRYTAAPAIDQGLPSYDLRGQF